MQRLICFPAYLFHTSKYLRNMTPTPSTKHRRRQHHQRLIVVLRLYVKENNIHHLSSRSLLKYRGARCEYNMLRNGGRHKISHDESVGAEKETGAVVGAKCFVLFQHLIVAGLLSSRRKRLRTPRSLRRFQATPPALASLNDVTSWSCRLSRLFDSLLLGYVSPTCFSTLRKDTGMGYPATSSGLPPGYDTTAPQRYPKVIPQAGANAATVVIVFTTCRLLATMMHLSPRCASFLWYRRCLFLA